MKWELCGFCMLLFSYGNTTDDKSDNEEVFKLADRIYLDCERNDYKH